MSNSIYGEDIAVLKDQMKDVKDALIRIETKLDSGAATYATKQELKTFKWLTVPIVIIVTAILSILIQYYFSNHSSTTITNNTSTTPSGNSSLGSSTAASPAADTPSTTSTATAHSDAATPADSQTSNGGVSVTVPKLDL